MNELHYKLIKSSEPYLVHYNHNHSKVNGQFISGPGGPRVEKRLEKIAKIDEELNDARNKKKLAKYARFNDKVAKANRKAEKARQKLEKGKKISDRDLRKLTKYNKLKTRQIKLQAKETELKSHLADLESKKAKLEKKNEKDIEKAWKKDLEELEEMERADKAMEKHGSSNLEWDLSPEEAKHVITDNEFSTFEKNPKTKGIKDVFIGTGTDLRTGKRDINLEGTSTTKVWKKEIQSKNGVHLIQENPTSVFYDGVGHESGAGIDNRKVKAIDSFATSKEGNQALYDGRDFAAEKMLNVYKNWSSDPVSKKLPENYDKKSFSRDISPSHISYGVDRNNKPRIKSVELVDKYDNFAGHVIWVDYDEKGKPKDAYLAG